MAVTDTSRKITYTGPGVGPFPITFSFLLHADIVVTRRRATLDPVRLNEGPDYSITDGEVTLAEALVDTDEVDIERTVTILQPVSFRTAGSFNPATHEAAFDRLTMAAQQIEARTAMAEASVAELLTRIPESGVWVGTSPPAERITYAQWASGVPGYWGWIDTSVRPADITAAVLDMAMTMAAPGTFLGIVNGGFEAAAVVQSPVPPVPVDAWYNVLSASGSRSADRVASAEMTGSYVGRAYALGTGPAYAQLKQLIPVERLAAIGNDLAFSIRPKALGGANSKAYVVFEAFDSGRARISEVSNDAAVCKLWGTATFQASADLTSLVIPTPAINTTYVKSFPLKTWLLSRLTAGKTWADVAYVGFSFSAMDYSNTTAVDFYLDGVS